MPKASGAEETRQQILEYVRKSEEAVVAAGRRWAAGIDTLVPGDSQAIRKLVDDAFDLTEAILKTQREFVNSLLKTVRGSDTSKRAPVGKTTASPAKSTTRPSKATKTSAATAKRRTSRA